MSVDSPPCPSYDERLGVEVVVLNSLISNLREELVNLHSRNAHLNTTYEALEAQWRDHDQTHECFELSSGGVVEVAYNSSCLHRAKHNASGRQIA